MKHKIKNLEKEIKALEKQGLDTSSLQTSIQMLKKDYQSKLSSWDRVLLARDPQRPSSLEFINHLFSDFIELHGDRRFGDDGAVVAGIAKFHKYNVTVIAIVKGKDMEDNKKRNYGMVHPEGYRKALRLMKQAEKFKRPIITLIDTPGAYPGMEAEARGQGNAIAENLFAMAKLKVPIISIIIGEAGSGGALALALANQVWIMENAIYSILSPEGFASILYKDASKAKDIVDDMKITSNHLLKLGIVDRVIEEGENGLEDDFNAVMSELDHFLLYELNAYEKMRPRAIQKERQARFRKMGNVDYEQ